MTALRDALFTSSTATGLLARCRFPSDETLHCAVSGGADSLALLLLACRTERKVTAWHVDHGLRSDSANDFAFVNDIAVRLGVKAELRTVRVEQGPNIEARARDARFAVLPPNVLTGHTGDDQAETVIINLLRGSGTAGLSGMTREGHPLLGLRRHETRSLCDELGLTPLSDPMNEDDRFQRVRIRNEVLPLLGDVAKRDVVDVLVRQSELLRDDDDFLDVRQVLPRAGLQRDAHEEGQVAGREDHDRVAVVGAERDSRPLRIEQLVDPGLQLALLAPRLVQHVGRIRLRVRDPSCGRVGVAVTRPAARRRRHRR